MKECPILFSAPMVRAILAGNKTQTRRIVKPQPSAVEYWLHGKLSDKHKGTCVLRDDGGTGWTISCGKFKPFYGQPAHQEIINGPMLPANRLWVKETFRLSVPAHDGDTGYPIYRADFTTAPKGLWKPSIFMPRWASRITLEIVSVRVERLQDISADDAEKEGCGCGVNDATGGPVARYCKLWESINGKGSWAINPWVWVIEFKKI